MVSDVYSIWYIDMENGELKLTTALGFQLLVMHPVNPRTPSPFFPPVIIRRPLCDGAVSFKCNFERRLSRGLPARRYLTVECG